MTRRQVEQARDWYFADWESHDIDRDVRTLIHRLLLTLEKGMKK